MADLAPKAARSVQAGPAALQALARLRRRQTPDPAAHQARLGLPLVPPVLAHAALVCLLVAAIPELRPR